MLSTRSEAGCLSCSLSTDAYKHAEVVIQCVEEWSSEDDLKRELRSARFSALAELMERASRYPSVQFALPGSIRGIDYANEVRGSDMS